MTYEVVVSGQTLNYSSLSRSLLTKMIPFMQFRDTGTVTRRSCGKDQKRVGQEILVATENDTSFKINMAI